MQHVEIRVIGEPKPKGSHRAFVRGGRPIVTNDCKTARAWEYNVHWAARAAYSGPLLDGPVLFQATFIMPRVTGVPKKRIDVPHVKKPDLDKITRNTWDGLVGVVLADDARICRAIIEKRYANPGESPGCLIQVGLLEAAS